MPSPVVELLTAVSEALDEAKARWYLFGGQAVLVHGLPRLTADVDVTVDIGERPARQLVGALQRHGFELRVADSDAFIARTRVIPVTHAATQIPLDVVLAGPGIEEQFFERAATHLVEGLHVPVASAEDIVTMKVLAGRTKDLEDAAGIIACQANALDFGLVRRTLRLLEQALDRSDLVPLFENLVRRVAKR